MAKGCKGVTSEKYVQTSTAPIMNPKKTTGKPLTMHTTNTTASNGGKKGKK